MKVKNWQGAANVGVNNENSNQEETEYDNVIFHDNICKNCEKKNS